MAAATAPISTYKTYLMYKSNSTDTTYAKLLDIKSFPDLGGEPERIDVTTLSDKIRKYTAGVQDLSSFSFNANYIAADYSKVLGLEGTQTEYAVWIGAETTNNTDTPNGANGRWSWTGDVSVYKAGGDVNSPQDMTITMFPSTDFAFTVPVLS